PSLQKKQKVIAKGVTPEEAVKTADRTPYECKINAAFQDAIDLNTGKINP
ncbi:hypothetical protein GW922_02250, partial [Candidatus Pacearchaeota archaeon]|nr:hypothetical protein [Candidatus Pacearchaeota archaeon]